MFGQDRDVAPGVHFLESLGQPSEIRKLPLRDTFGLLKPAELYLESEVASGHSVLLAGRIFIDLVIDAEIF